MISYSIHIKSNMLLICECNFAFIQQLINKQLLSNLYFNDIASLFLLDQWKQNQSKINHNTSLSNRSIKYVSFLLKSVFLSNWAEETCIVQHVVQFLICEKMLNNWADSRIFCFRFLYYITQWIHDSIDKAQLPNTFNIHASLLKNFYYHQPVVTKRFFSYFK